VAGIYLQKGEAQNALDRYEEAYSIIENIPDFGNGDFKQLREHLKLKIDEVSKL